MLSLELIALDPTCLQTTVQTDWSWSCVGWFSLHSESDKSNTVQVLTFLKDQRFVLCYNRTTTLQNYYLIILIKENTRTLPRRLVAVAWPGKAKPEMCTSKWKPEAHRWRHVCLSFANFLQFHFLIDVKWLDSSIQPFDPVKPLIYIFSFFTATSNGQCKICVVTRHWLQG